MVKEAKQSRRHACTRCGSTFANPSKRDLHLRSVHEKPKLRDHACPHCEAAFGQTSSLGNHMRPQHQNNAQNNECLLIGGQSVTNSAHET